MLGEEIRRSSLKLGDHAGKPAESCGRRMRNVSFRNGIVQYDQKAIEKSQSLRDVGQVRIVGYPAIAPPRDVGRLLEADPHGAHLHRLLIIEPLNGRIQLPNYLPNP